MNPLHLLALAAPAALLGYGAFQLSTALPVKEQRKDARPAVLCIGDSITFGAGVRRTRKNDCWPRMLERMKQGSLQVLNYGISGATLLRNGDSPYRPDFLAAARTQHPEQILLMLGTNDSKVQNWNSVFFRADTKALLAELQSWDARVTVLLPPWCCTRRPGEPVVFGIRNEVIRDGVIPVLRECAEELALPVIDLYQPTEGHPEYFTDGVHPNALGNRILAETIADRL